MKKIDREMVISRINNEGFHYCFLCYSDFEEIKDEKFHLLRREYIKAAENLKKHLKYEN